MPPKFSYEASSAFLYIHPTMLLRQPPCQAVCPAGVPVSLMNRLLARREHDKALAVLLDVTPFPEWLCENCARPCEKACNKGRATEAPVPIARLERLAASCLPDALPARAARTGRKVALVGNSATSLAAAYFLSRLGHDITLVGEEEVTTCPVPAFGDVAAIGRVRGYLSAHGTLFTEELPDARTLNAVFDAVLACSAIRGLETSRLFLMEAKTSSPAAMARAARLAACVADTALAGRPIHELAWLRIVDGTVDREWFPLDMPGDAKPVSVVRYEDMHNKEYFREHLTFRDRLAAGVSLEERAMECFHCGTCIGCGTCAAICPGDVLDMKDGKPYVRYPDECIHCSSCMLDCPTGAIFFRLPLPATLGAPMKYLA